MTTDLTPLAAAQSPSAAVAPMNATTFNFDQAWQMAQVLATSTLVPQSYRRKPENILLVTLAGSSYGWDPVLSMGNFTVIEGTVSIKPQAMLALIRQAKHSVQGTTSPEGASITAKRRDTGDEMQFSFTMEDAKRAGLVKGPWIKYPASMCWARCLSQVARMLFPDVVLAAYVPEEIGAEVGEDGVPLEPVQASVAAPALPEGHVAVGEAKTALMAVYTEGGFEKAEAQTYAGGQWKAHSLPGKGEAASISQVELDAVLAAATSEVEGQTTVVDAVVVEAEVVEFEDEIFGADEVQS